MKGFFQLAVALAILIVIGFGVIKFQEDMADCQRGRHNVQCPEEVNEWPQPGEPSSTLIH